MFLIDIKSNYKKVYDDNIWENKTRDKNIRENNICERVERKKCVIFCHVSGRLLDGFDKEVTALPYFSIFH
jgi:hypothetical protein